MISAFSFSLSSSSLTVPGGQAGSLQSSSYCVAKVLAAMAGSRSGRELSADEQPGVQSVEDRGSRRRAANKCTYLSQVARRHSLMQDIRSNAVAVLRVRGSNIL